MKSPVQDKTARNILYLTLLVFVLSLQVLIIVVFIYQFVPMPQSPITEGVPSELLKLFKPNRNEFFYHVFIVTAIVGQVTALWIYRRSLDTSDVAGEIRPLLIGETVWVSWQLFAVFKILQYDHPPWAGGLLYAGFGAAVLAKIFWPELGRGLKHVQGWLSEDIPVWWNWLADGGVILFLALALAIPHPERAFYLMGDFDNYMHFDQWLMAPLLDYSKGLASGPSPLNGGVLALVHSMADAIGGVTYQHVLVVLCFLAVLYYSIFYYLLRYWFGVLPAVFGVLLAVKLQMFNIGISPLVWNYPEQGMLRHMFDMVVFGFLLFYAQGRGEAFLWMAAGAVGVSLAMVFDTGMYMLAAFYVYLAVLLSLKDTRIFLCPVPRQWRKVLAMAVLPYVVMVVALALCIGSKVLHPAFWMDLRGGVAGWLNDLGPVSVFSCLKTRNFFAFFASFFPPLLYAVGISSAIYMVSRRFWGKEKLFLVPLSVYGLGVYALFLWHASINYYYTVPPPLAGCLCFWGTSLLQGMAENRRRLAKLILATLAVIALLTNSIFTYYPNIFNLAGLNWGQLKSYYQASHTADFIKGHE